MRSKIITVLATAFLVIPAQGQMRGTVAVAPGSPGRGGLGLGFRGVRGGFHFGHRPGFNHRFYPAYFYPYGLFPDYGYDDPPQQAQPPVVVVQNTPPAQPAPTAEPLLIEWQGDHFVRMPLSDYASSHGQGTGPDYSEKNDHRLATENAKNPAPSSQEPAPATLVYRDGHQEQVTSYTIMGPVMYTRSDYWTSGSWNKKIPLAELDVPATLKLNQERGVNFRMPASPNEVVIRP